jgi:hypothetical protein
MATRSGRSNFSSDSSSGGLRNLNLILEATSLLHSQVPLDSVLGTVLDHAIAVTDADRALLLEPDSTGSLRFRSGRRGEACACCQTPATTATSGANNTAPSLQAFLPCSDFNLATAVVSLPTAALARTRLRFVGRSRLQSVGPQSAAPRAVPHG